MKMRRVVTAVLLASLVFAACGDDDESSDATSGGSDGDPQAYCDAAAALDENEVIPTDEQFDELAELAPEAIKDDVDLVVERFKDVGPDAFTEGEVDQAIARIEAYEVDECGREPEEEAQAEEPDPDAVQIEVNAVDYAFELDEGVPTGKVAFILQNDGEEPHELSLVRLADGTTLDDAEAAADSGPGEIQSLMQDEIGETTEVEPGGTGVLNAELEPGVYGMACFVPDPEGNPHFIHGMYLFFETTEG